MKPFKHLLTMEQLSAAEIDTILNKAETFIQPDGRISSEYPYLQGKTVANLFFEPSTRTRSTFELAAKKLGAEVINLDIESSSTQKGESIKDTFLTMLAMQCDAVVIRHPEEGIAEYVASLSDQVSVLNAGDGAHAHPTQALLDLLTIRRHKGDFKKLSVAIVGDILHSRVARSQIAGLKAVGVKDIRVIAPRELLPDNADTLGVKLFHDLNAGLSGVDVIITLRLQFERMKGALINDQDAYFKTFGIKTDTLKFAKPDAIVMHPGPINREVEISSEVADGAQSLILQQVTYGLAVRMAVLTLLELS
jgi:aspartate carbamoyltransferase catalytic subunit